MKLLETCQHFAARICGDQDFYDVTMDVEAALNIANKVSDFQSKNTQQTTKPA